MKWSAEQHMHTQLLHGNSIRSYWIDLLIWIDLSWFDLIRSIYWISGSSTASLKKGGYPVPEKNAKENKSHLIKGWRDKMRWVPYWSLTTTQCRLLTLFVAISYITFITFLHILKYNKCSIYTILCMRFVMEYKKTTAHLQHLQMIIRPLKFNYVLLTV